MASRLVLLDKNPGLRTIGLGKVLRRIAGKNRDDCHKGRCYQGSSKAQMRGRESGSEAAVLAMKDLFEAEQSDAVLLVEGCPGL